MGPILKLRYFHPFGLSKSPWSPLLTGALALAHPESSVFAIGARITDGASRGT